MTHLVIENQNSNVEIVSVAIIQKVYEMALSAQGSVSLKGNLQSEHAKQTAYNYLTGNLTGTSTKRFPELSLNITGGLYIDFEDSLVEQTLLSKNIGDGIGITQSDLYEINRIEGSWFDSSNITSFNELQYFKPSAVNQQGIFQNCNHLTEVTLPSGITSITIQCFKNDNLLETVNNTSSLTVLEKSSFEGCSSLETIDLQNIVTIKQYSFAQCGNLRSIGTGAPTTVGGHAFENCSSFTSIDLSSTTTFGERAFYNSGLSGVVDISSCTTTNIFDTSLNVFTKCANITSIINVPSSVTVLGSVNVSGEGPFFGCSSLVKFDGSSSGITTIKSRAFRNCPAINIIKLPNTVTSIAAMFSHCTYANNIKIYLPCATPPTLSENGQNGNKLNYQSAVFQGDIEIYVPDANVSNYQNDPDWSTFTIKAISTWSE